MPQGHSPPNAALSPAPRAAPVFQPAQTAQHVPRGGAQWPALLPLQGVTILVVDDSRFACEALRLIARRAGARLRRAETLAAARDHLRVYRPDVVLVDLGLPDGRGDLLIRQLVDAPRRPPVVIGISGRSDGRALVMAAGADGYLDKPLENIAQLCRVLRPLLPDLDIYPPPLARDHPLVPDPLALHDDLAFAHDALCGQPDADRQRYIGAFVAGLARQGGDAGLAAAADRLQDAGAASHDAAEAEARLAPLRAALAARLKQGPDFVPPD